MTKHTDARLEVKQSFYLYFPGDQFSAAEMKSCNTVPADRAGEHEANALRLAASWNACADIPTEILATDGFSVMEALRQREALLAACERLSADITRYLERGGSLTPTEAESVRLLNEAIALCRPEEPR